VGEVEEETVAGGRIVYLEYTEDCPSHRNHANTILKGFAQKGTTFLQFGLVVTAAIAETKPLALEVPAKFQGILEAVAGVPRMMRDATIIDDLGGYGVFRLEFIGCC
jgi:hypothetical protein